MSRLEDALAAGRFVVTAELLTIDTGGLDAVHERFAPYEDYVDAVNAPAIAMYSRLGFATDHIDRSFVGSV